MIEETQEQMDKALLIIEAVKGELALGTKHYRRNGGQQLITLPEIITAMRDNNLIFEPVPERRWLYSGHCGR